MSDSDKQNSTELLESVIKELQLILNDSQKADTGNGAAAVRARKRILNVISILKETRAVLHKNKVEAKTKKGE